MARAILVVDDEPHIRALLLQTLEDLEDQDVELLTAADGEQALALIERHRPDLVLLDIRLPGMDGFEVCRAVRADPELAQVRVVLLTARGLDADRDHAHSVGADEFRTKPFDPDAILALARERLGLDA